MTKANRHPFLRICRQRCFFPVLILLTLVAANLSRAQVFRPGSDSRLSEADLKAAIARFRTQPRIAAQYDYIMSARVRLLLFWVGKDDVGGGYIRRGTSLDGDGDRAQEIQLLMGSDPNKAPRAINRWGAASELFEKAGPDVKESTFFGFMKTSQGNSPGEMEKELSQEADGRNFLFSAIIDRTSASGEFVKVLPFASDTDFTIHDLDRVFPDVLGRLAGPKGVEKTADPLARTSGSCVGGFLSSVSDLVEVAIETPGERSSACYVYNAQPHRLTLQHATAVSSETVELSLFRSQQKYVRTYHDLVSAQIEDVSETTGRRSKFQLLLGTKGDLRGVPVRITYQPNWWFQVILNLRTVA
jgi:hypothetical protein